MEQNWEDVYVDNVNVAYDAFLKLFMVLYNKHCPVVSKIKTDKSASKPWLTKGIQRACKKKNKVYKEFLKNKTKETECAYKTYKNKLISIMRSSKINYFSDELEKNKQY